MNARQARSKAIMEMPYHFSQYAQDKFKVRSQTDPDKYYVVTATDNGLVCECLDHQTRKADCKHIKVVLEKLKTNKGFANTPFRIMERSVFKLCKYCDSGNIVKNGYRQTKQGKVQTFKCMDCKKRFGLNCGFESRRYDPRIITQALQMYYQGMSARDVADNYEMMGIDVTYRTVFRWISQYSTLVEKYVKDIVPRTKSRVMVRADEAYVNVAGIQRYLFSSMDDDSRFWLVAEMAKTKHKHNADNLLKLTRDKIGRTPAHFKTDGLAAYEKSSRKVFGNKTTHHRHIHLKGDMNNNKMERLNGEFRDREKVFRGVKKFDSPIIYGIQTYYNYTKKHSGIGGKTPAEEAKILVDGKNKWLTLIQNARLYKIAE